MSIDWWILLSSLFIGVFLIWKFVPREKAREAWIIALFLQSITWVSGLFVVEMKWISYPVALLPRVNEINKASFSFEFFLFPVLAILFSLNYPTYQPLWLRFFYYTFIIGFFTFIEVLLEWKNNLVKYDEWKWYWTFITVWFSLFLNHQYYSWYKKKWLKE
ncbi:CBO0543 family protein [Priestia endophytica]|uniref:Competence protein n=1 Tax=Priestia endophytica TaxID=135735 RepID=A0AAX1Q6K3_9BACI|nr:CBO0543 family protein [Priestia endophytica]RAS75573.1 hypothetical protein A3864_15545 [Priestia endophytica]RAS91128.1 hypothetical protein A3863_06860 [Priestia endophytica]